MSRFVVFCTVLILTAGLALAATPAQPVSLEQAIRVWLAAAVRVQGTPDHPKYVNCYGGFESLIPADQQRLALALKSVSSYLMNETAPEMHGDPATYKARVAAKTNWSASVIELLRAALVDAGFTPGDGFPEDGVVILTAAVPPKCSSGTCYCTPCDPTLLCDCKTAPVSVKDSCFGARKDCDVFEEKPWMKGPGQWAIHPSLSTLDNVIR